MANFIVMEDGKAVRRVVADDLEIIQALLPDSDIIEETEETGIAYDSVGFDHISKRFFPPKLFDSWVFNETLWLYEPPVQMPTDGFYQWSEELASWVEVPLESE
jgi:hypothetical protein